MTDRKLVLSIKGDRETVLNNFKAVCATKGISMTSRLFDLMENDNSRSGEGKPHRR